jgi:aminopeptidase-like protein
MSRRGLYPIVGARPKEEVTRLRMNILAYSDGIADLLQIADTINAPIERCAPIVEELEKAGLLEQLTT